MLSGILRPIRTTTPRGGAVDLSNAIQEVEACGAGVDTSGKAAPQGGEDVQPWRNIHQNGLWEQHRAKRPSSSIRTGMENVLFTLRAYMGLSGQPRCRAAPSRKDHPMRFEVLLVGQSLRA